MTKHSMPDMKEGGVNVTPLIDVVMCLIIFFILVAKIGVSSGIDNKIEAPKTFLGVKIADMGNVLVLNIHRKAGGGVQVVATVPGKGPQEILLEDYAVSKLDDPRRFPLRAVLKQMREDRKDAFKVVINAGKEALKDAQGQTMKGPDGEPLFDTESEATFAEVSRVLEQCAVAGVTNIAFTARKGGEPFGSLRK